MASALKKMLDQKDEMTPDKGFNLVGLDDYEDAGEQLYPLGHYTTQARAEAAQKIHAKKNKDVKTFIYAADSEEGPRESISDAMARLLADD